MQILGDVLQNRLPNRERDLLILDARVKAVVELMRQSRGHLSISILARSVNLSASRLRQIFHKETGQSPIQYLRVVRLSKAEELLQGTFLSVKEITSQCGIGDVSHFVRDFKEKYGMTPSEFRAQKTLTLAKCRTLRGSRE